MRPSPTLSQALPGLVVIHPNRMHRMVRWRCIIHVSYYQLPNGSLKQLYLLVRYSGEGLFLLVTEPTQALLGLVVIHHDRTTRMASAGDASLKFLTYQLPTVGY